MGGAGRGSVLTNSNSGSDVEDGPGVGGRQVRIPAALTVRLQEWGKSTIDLSHTCMHACVHAWLRSMVLLHAMQHMQRPCMARATPRALCAACACHPWAYAPHRLAGSAWS